MSTPLILDLLFDDSNLDEMAAHGVSPRQLLQVLDNGPRIGRNRKERRALYIMVGLDDGGTCIAAPLEATNDPSVWRPVTAWRCKKQEWGLLP